MADNDLMSTEAALSALEIATSTMGCNACNVRTEGVILVDEKEQRPDLSATPNELKIKLDVIEQNILPETERVSGAAILKEDLSCSVASTNTETNFPIFHGEVKCIYGFSKKTAPELRGPLAESGAFLATHESCCVCISSILWTGFRRILYFLPYETTTAQGIPHHVNTLHELWGVSIRIANGTI
jgi:tRNA(Arg) A34 adenosine deaminase TadA